jgi:Na+/H+ antiporter NhaD/arsenite permease-like protein
MVIASTKPVLFCARRAIQILSGFLQKLFKMPPVFADLLTILTLGPLSGSLITEPAAMTVTAFLLLSMLEGKAEKIIYPLLAVLFVNVSIGGALTPFAAPPILMVAHKWGWDLNFVFMHLGWKAIIAVLINSIGLVFIFRNSFRRECKPLAKTLERVPPAVGGLHLVFLVLLILTSHHQNAFIAVFLLFLGLVFLTRDYQEKLRLKEALLVAVFLGGIIVFGSFQSWWLTPLISHLGEKFLFGGAVLLTAITDNAALTYLGAQVSGLSESARYALVAGALSGGGLTLIANAPNAAGFTILSGCLPNGLQPLRLFKAAILPTLVACALLLI